MFVRIKTTPNSPRKSVQICESQRDGKKVRQKIIRYVGIAMDEQELEALKILANQILIKIEEEGSRMKSLFPPEGLGSATSTSRSSFQQSPRAKPTELVKLSDLIEKTRLVSGIQDVYGSLFDELGFSKTFASSELNCILRSVVLARIANPSSKRRTAAFLEKDFGINTPLHKLYKMMDGLFPKIETIKKAAFYATKNLFKEKLDIVFFDVTTLYFESTNEDKLRKFGYSKDQKFHSTQVVLALATTSEGLPIGYELFSGNTAEVSTLLHSLTEWKKSFEIGKVIFVADRAMMSAANLKLLNDEGHEYIIAAKIRAMKADVKTHVQKEEGYAIQTLSEDSGLFWIKDQQLGENQRLISSYNTRRARKDAKDRDRILQKLDSLLSKDHKPSKLVSNSGYKKFTKSTGGVATIDFDKVGKDAEWDGIHGIITNSKAPATEVLKAYRRLWIIEDSFRVTKHDIATRPIFHFSPERIHSHIAICFIAYTLIRHAQYRIKLQSQPMSPEKIRNELLSVQVSIVQDKTTGGLYSLPSSISVNSQKIYRVFGLKHSLTPQKL